MEDGRVWGHPRLLGCNRGRAEPPASPQGAAESVKLKSADCTRALPGLFRLSASPGRCTVIVA